MLFRSLRVPSQYHKSTEDMLSQYGNDYLPQMGGLINFGNESRQDNESLASSAVKFNIKGVDSSRQISNENRKYEKSDYDIDLNKFEAFRHYGEDQKGSRITGTFGGASNSCKGKEDISAKNSSRVYNQGVKDSYHQDSFLKALEQSRFSSQQNSHDVNVYNLSKEDMDNDFEKLKEGEIKKTTIEKTAWESLRGSLGAFWSTSNPNIAQQKNHNQQESLAFRAPPGRNSRVPNRPEILQEQNVISYNLDDAS